MLKIRVLTAVILGPLFILGVFLLPPTWFALLAGAVVLLGAWEWARLSGFQGTGPAIAAVTAVAILMAVVYRFREPASEPLLAAACAAWLAVAALLYHRRARAPVSWPPAARLASGALVLVPAWLALVALQDIEPGAVFIFLVVIWAADTGAYFAGRRWGRRKLAPAISPGKSVEGVGGGVLAAAAAAAVLGYFWDMEGWRWPALVAWSVLVVLVSVSGDLFESNWKRLVKLKDSGGMLPGHGGVLDRIDSVTAAAPFFALGWLWWFESAPA